MGEKVLVLGGSYFVGRKIANDNPDYSNEFSSNLIRFYYGQDLVGNEIGSAAKNIIGKGLASSYLLLPQYINHLTEQLAFYFNNVSISILKSPPHILNLCTSKCVQF